MLSALESELYYLNDREPNEENEKAHEIIKNALIEWHNLTGCTNE